MQQVVVVHGGTSFDTHEEYIAFLKTRELNLEKLKQGGEDWKAALARDLGPDFEVLLPRMPNTTNARYAEWALWLDRCAEFIRDDVILIGHSLGGIFLAKYLSEQSLSRRIKATILVGAPFDTCSTDESLTDFALPESLVGLAEQGGNISLVYSKDDPVVPFAEAAHYQQALPRARPLFFEDRGHFNQPRFPELVALLRSFVVE